MFDVTPEMHNRMNNYISRLGTSKAAFIKVAIDQFLRDNEDGK